MKKVIVYETKSGTTKNAAELLKEQLPDIEVINIKEQTPAINDYDLIVFGGAYYAGALNRKLKKYIKKNKESLANKKYAFYICCVSEDDYKEVLIKNLGEEIVNNAVITECFGYEVNTKNAKGFTKFILKIMEKAMRKENKPLQNLHKDKIQNFAKIIKSTK